MMEVGVLKKVNFEELGRLDCCMFKLLAKKRNNSYGTGHRSMSQR